MNRLSDEKIIDSWMKNATPWATSIQKGEIESRRLVTNQAVITAVRSCKPTIGIDIGCGEGWLVRTLQDVEMVGIDAVPDLIDQARQAGSGDFRVMSYEEIARGKLKMRADVAVCNFSLLGKEAVEGLFHAAGNYLKADGALIVQTLHPVIACGTNEYKDGWRAGNWDSFGPGYNDPPPWYFRTINSWVNLYISAGLRLERICDPLHPNTGKPASILFIGRTLA